MTKRRFRSANGAIFVPNVGEATIRQKVAAGEWVEMVNSPAAAATTKPRRRRVATARHAD